MGSVVPHCIHRRRYVSQSTIVNARAELYLLPISMHLYIYSKIQATFYFRSGSVSMCEYSICHDLDLQNSPVNCNIYRPLRIVYELAHSHNKLYFTVLYCKRCNFYFLGNLFTFDDNSISTGCTM